MFMRSTRPAPSRTPALISKMWLIGGPRGMSCEAAKRALGIRPGPRDLLIYSQYNPAARNSPVPRLISCGSYQN